MLFGSFVDWKDTPKSQPVSPYTVLDARFYPRFADMADYEGGKVFIEIDGVYREIRRIDFEIPNDIKLFHVLGGPVKIELDTQLIYSLQDFSGLPATVKQ